MTIQKAASIVAAGFVLGLTASLVHEPLGWWESEKLGQVIQFLKENLLP